MSVVLFPLVVSQYTVAFSGCAISQDIACRSRNDSPRPLLVRQALKRFAEMENTPALANFSCLGKHIYKYVAYITI